MVVGLIWIGWFWVGVELGGGGLGLSLIERWWFGVGFAWVVVGWGLIGWRFGVELDWVMVGWG